MTKLRGPSHVGRGGMGSRKHGRSGTCGPSPKLKHWQEREGRKEEEKRKKQPMYGSVVDAFKNHKIQ